jgi:predicted nucleotidyltransferase component of viral defense system
MSDTSKTLMYHDDPDRFRAALTYTSATTGFLAALIEKDYYCSLLLNDLGELMRNGLVFKGGTCLSKVHTEFFRLSEDLDFTYSIPAGTSRPDRRKIIAPFKGYFASIPERLLCFRITQELNAKFESSYYFGSIGYISAITGEVGSIKLEVSLKEPIHQPVEDLVARTILCDPHSKATTFLQVPVRVLSIKEAYAEKTRAALTRRKPAIRDFFDVDHAVLNGLLFPQDEATIELISHKLSTTDDPIDISDARVDAVQIQVETQLKSVVRLEDFKKFDLRRVVETLREMVECCGKKQII